MFYFLATGAALIILLFLPLDRISRRRQRQRAHGRVDERDVMFARMARAEGTPEYGEYYGRRPELKNEDDRIRAMIPLYAPGSRHYHPDITREAEDYFKAIDVVESDEARVDRLASRLIGAPDPSKTVAEMVKAMGAVDVGFAPMPQEYVYTHKGRFEEDYGREVRLDHPGAIVFLVEMDYDQMRRAPRAEAIRESARQYFRAAGIAKTVEAALRAAGYDAKAHYDAHYDIILPPLAVEAGLGEVGRNNILIADRFGSRIRIGAVTTDMPLSWGSPVRLGAGEFCAICRKCADNCPARALSTGLKQPVRGVEKWPTSVERCYAYWRHVGTDCGICMAVCPFSHRNNRFHNLVRRAVKLNPWIRRIALFLDDLIYGRHWKPAGPD